MLDNISKKIIIPEGGNYNSEDSENFKGFCCCFGTSSIALVYLNPLHILGTLPKIFCYGTQLALIF